MSRLYWPAIAIALLGLQLLSATSAASDSVEDGRRLARSHCSRCHSIDKVGPSPLSLAPPFRMLHERYPVETLQEALAEGLTTGHAQMPEFRFDADQVGNFIAFLKSLE
jgi:mono/diheme cytochrome c family protein